jgi:tRNA threonylcarbamoyladenosine biosynthesis protein TsaB
MRVLSLDTSSTYLSIALCDEDRVLAQSTSECGRAHAERLLATLARLLEDTGIELKNIDLLAVTNGPGSFTGLRIGLAHWKGLALAHQLPLMAVPTLDAFARQAGVQDGHVCPMMDANMGEIFAAWYRYAGGERVMERAETVCSPNSILEVLPQDTILLGDGAQRYRHVIADLLPHASILKPEACVLQATTVAAEARDRTRRGFPADAASVPLVYLRQSQPEELRQRGTTPQGVNA